MTDVMLHPAQPPSIDRGRHRAGVRRVEVKHLRYALELFEPALGEQAQPLLVALVAAQDHLGELHDAEIALARASDDEGLTACECETRSMPRHRRRSLPSWTHRGRSGSPGWSRSSDPIAGARGQAVARRFLPRSTRNSSGMPSAARPTSHGATGPVPSAALAGRK